jgi:tetratricopeptide (TPR) repeat protein
MSILFEATKSKEIFVGRGPEREMFAEILDGKRPEWIVHIPGEGGIGKTRLLETLRQDVRKKYPRALVTQGLVDFYNVANQTGFGLLSEIAQAINPTLFENFFSAREQFDRLLENEPEPVQRQEASRRVLDAFLEDYKMLLSDGHKIVWLLDTCEEMGKVEEYLLEKLLPKIAELEETLFDEAQYDDAETVKRQTTIMIAGRKPLKFSEVLDGQILEWRLSNLSLSETEEFFKAAHEKAEIGVLSEEKLLGLYNITDGRPLYLALSYDWLKNEVGTIDELLSLKAPLGETLVGWVRRLDTLEKRAIRYAALAWRRMEPSLLGQLLDIDENKAISLIQQLGKFSFVKYRPQSDGQPGAFQLHDEMRDLINRYVDLQEGDIAKNKLLLQVIKWYEKRIDDDEMMAGKKLPSQGELRDDETRALLSEWLYYQCQQDLKKGFVKYDRLFRNAIHYLDLAFCDLLNREVERFRGLFNNQQKDDLDFKEALAAFRREQYGLAGTIWHSLVRKDDLIPNIKSTALMLLVELDSYAGKPNEAIEHAEEAEGIYLQLISSASTEEKSLFEAESGQLYNNRGYAYRVKGDMESALKYYEKALTAPGGRKKNIARTLNNMGFIYYLQGDMVKARTYVGRALQMRRDLNIPYELGLGYNTMGIIMEHGGRMDEAADLYQKAMSSFIEARSARGEALVAVNLGRIDRKTNHFEKAEDELLKAVKQFRSKGDIDNLIVALNELGCVYRQRGDADDANDWEKAEELFKESLSHSEAVGNIANQVDNLQDLSILYTRKAIALRKRGNESAEKFAGLARETAEKVGKLSEQHGYQYLLAKKERTLAELGFQEGDYEDAFSRYFEACRLMALAQESGGDSPILSQRRYEEMVDRLQEQLQSLLDPDTTREHAQIMLGKYAKLEPKEQKLLATLHSFLKAADDIAMKVRS